MPARPPAWYERDGGRRLAAERELLAAAYPDLAFRIDQDERRVHLEGRITLVAQCGIRTPIGTRISLSQRHPYREPIAFETEGRFPWALDRHLLSDGYCCLWLPPESQWQSDDPEALLRFVDQLALFFERQLIYDVTGKWPGPERGHGFAGYLEFVCELLDGNQALARTLAPAFAGNTVGRNAPCPCGSGAKFKKCHRVAVSRVRQAVGLDQLQRAFRDMPEADIKHPRQD